MLILYLWFGIIKVKVKLTLLEKLQLVTAYLLLQQPLCEVIVLGQNSPYQIKKLKYEQEHVIHGG